jgi:hypothetical protein
MSSVDISYKLPLVDVALKATVNLQLMYTKLGHGQVAERQEFVGRHCAGMTFEESKSALGPSLTKGTWNKGMALVKSHPASETIKLKQKMGICRPKISDQQLEEVALLQSFYEIRI